MGYDRVRFYDGVDGKSNLISADKQSHYTATSPGFLKFLGIIGFKASLAVDWDKTSAQNAPLVAKGAVPVPYPAKSRGTNIVGKVDIEDVVVRVEPPISPDRMKLVERYLNEFCEPTDAGPIYLDYRGDHNGCHTACDGVNSTHVRLLGSLANRSAPPQDKP